MPATAMLILVIFVAPCLVKRTRLFRPPSGVDRGAGAIALRATKSSLGVGSINRERPVEDCSRGWPFLSEQLEDSRFRETNIAKECTGCFLIKI